MTFVKNVSAIDILDSRCTGRKIIPDEFLEIGHDCAGRYSGQTISQHVFRVKTEITKVRKRMAAVVRNSLSIWQVEYFSNDPLVPIQRP